jgi:lipid-binding SYLF domain-containing protein
MMVGSHGVFTADDEDTSERLRVIGRPPTRTLAPHAYTRNDSIVMPTKQLLVVCLVALLCATLVGCAAPGGQADTSPDARRAHLMDVRNRTLADLYAEKPEVRAEIQTAVGYAVFDASQVNLLLYVGAHGGGVLIENGKTEPTYMKMTRAGTGPGVGYKTFRQVLVFKDRKLFDAFRTIGADVGASGDAAIKLGGKGASLDGTVSFNPELSVYQITDQGLLLQANWGGVAYLPDPDLNR